MRRPSNRQLSCTFLVLAGLWLGAPRASAQVPQPPALGSQPSSYVVDSNELGVVLPPPATVTTVKPRKAKKAAVANVPTTVVARILDPISAPSAATAGATSAGVGYPDGIPESAWAALRKCESGGNNSINSGNGYYGAYQFAASTWRKLGYSGLPHEASPATQDEAARKLQNQQGWAPWPACTRKLGLR